MARPVRTVVRTRNAAPHLPEADDAALLLVDAAVLPVPSVEALLAALDDAQLNPVAVVRPGRSPRRTRPMHPCPSSAASSRLPRAGTRRDRVPGRRAGRAGATLQGPSAGLCRGLAVGPAARHAGRADRGPHRPGRGNQRGRGAARPSSAPGRARPGRAVRRAPCPAAGRRVPRPSRSGPAGAGGAVADRAPHSARRRGLAVRRLALRAVDEVAADADGHGPGAAPPACAGRGLGRSRDAGHPLEKLPAASRHDPLQDTPIAVARSNGRVAPAARLLGVHRNTVLYCLRRARDERGIDPRRPQDALRILSEIDEPRSRPTQ